MSKCSPLILLAILVPCFNVTEPITPDEILEEYHGAQEGSRFFLVKSEALVEIRDTEEGSRPAWNREDEELRTHEGRFDLITQKWRNIDSEDAPLSGSDCTTTREIWDSKQYFSINSLESESGVYNFAYMAQEDAEMSRDLAIGFTGAPLLGILRGDLRRVDEILQEAGGVTLREEMEAVGGDKCYVLDSSTPNGEYTIWIDPERGYNIRKAEVRKGRDNILYGRSMSTPPKPRPRGLASPVTAGDPLWIVGLSFSLKNVRFEKIDDTWVPAEADYEERAEFSSGRVITTKTRHNRTSIDFQPDLEAIGAFVPDMPDNTPVTVKGLESIRYKWVNGKTVPDIDDVLIEALDETAGALRLDGGFRKPQERSRTESVKPEAASDDSRPGNKQMREATKTRDAESLLRRQPRPAKLLAVVAVVLVTGLSVWLLARRRKERYR
jgi:hypothetical protein